MVASVFNACGIIHLDVDVPEFFACAFDRFDLIYDIRARFVFLFDDSFQCLNLSLYLLEAIDKVCCVFHLGKLYTKRSRV